MKTSVTELSDLTITKPTTQGHGGLCVAQVSEVERNRLVPKTNGTIIYNTTTNKFEFCQNDVWVSMGEDRFEPGLFNAENANKALHLNGTGTRVTFAGIAMVVAAEPVRESNKVLKQNLNNKTIGIALHTHLNRGKNG